MLTGDLLERYLLATAVTFGLLALCGWLAQKYGHSAPTGGNDALKHFWSRLFTAKPRAPFGGTPGKPDKMRKRESVVLTPQHQLHKVQDGQRVYLLATHPHGTTLISSTLEAPSRPLLTDDPDAPLPFPRPAQR